MRRKSEPPPRKSGGRAPRRRECGSMDELAQGAPARRRRQRRRERRATATALRAARRERELPSTTPRAPRERGAAGKRRPSSCRLTIIQLRLRIKSIRNWLWLKSQLSVIQLRRKLRLWSADNNPIAPRNQEHSQLIPAQEESANSNPTAPSKSSRNRDFGRLTIIQLRLRTKSMRN